MRLEIRPLRGGDAVRRRWTARLAGTSVALAVVALATATFPNLQDSAEGTTQERRESQHEPRLPLDTWPAWKADGRALVFQSNRSSLAEPRAPTSLWSVDAGGGEAAPVLRAYGPSNPDCARDGRLIAFHCGHQIYVFDVVDYRAWALFHGSQLASYPSWGPDSRRLAFVSYKGTDPDIWIATIDLSRKYILTSTRKLITMEGGDSLPAWSPDGRQIAFVHEGSLPGTNETEWEIWTVEADGRGLRRVAAFAGDERVERLFWFPDSRRLLVSQSRWFYRQRVTLEPKPPADLGSLDDPPESEKCKFGYYMRNYAPAGGYIVIRYERDANGEPLLESPTKIVDTQTGRYTTVELAQHACQRNRYCTLDAAAVSPDGSRLAFSHPCSGAGATHGQSIWVCDIDGAHAREVTKPPIPPSETPVVLGFRPTKLPQMVYLGLGDALELGVSTLLNVGADHLTHIRLRLSREGEPKRQLHLDLQLPQRAIRAGPSETDQDGEFIALGADATVTELGWRIEAAKSTLERKHETLLDATLVLVAQSADAVGDWFCEARAASDNDRMCEWTPAGHIVVEGSAATR